MDVQRRSGQIHGQIFHLSLLIFAFGRMRSSNHKQRGSYKLHSTMWLCYFLYPPHIIYITQKYLMDCCPFMSIHEVFVVSRYILHRFSSCRQNKKYSYALLYHLERYKCVFLERVRWLYLMDGNRYVLISGSWLSGVFVCVDAWCEIVWWPSVLLRAGYWVFTWILWYELINVGEQIIWIL